MPWLVAHGSSSMTCFFQSNFFREIWAEFTNIYAFVVIDAVGKEKENIANVKTEQVGDDPVAFSFRYFQILLGSI